jgi:hypothetical protein
MATQDRTSDETPEEQKPPNDGTIVYLNRGSGDLEKHPGEFIDPRAAPPIPLPPKLRTVRDCKSYLAHATFDIAASIFTLPLSKFSSDPVSQ